MNKRGFTLIELMIVITISSVIVLIGALSLSTGSGRNHLVNVTTDIVDTVRRAQWQTMNGSQDDVWGVHFEVDKFTLYKGSSFIVGETDNIQTILPDSVSLSSIIVVGGGSDVLFNDEFGDTSTPATITVNIIETSEQKMIIINSVGLVKRN